MPRLGNDDENLQQFKANHFGFSGVGIGDNLGASEYTLVTLIADRSGSTRGFQAEMEAALKETIRACMDAPRADNLLLRVVSFEDSHQEVHGFKLLSSINLDSYDGILSPGGMTALYDAATDGIEAENTYGRELTEKDYDVNGIVVIITDGLNNRGKCTVNQVKQALEKAVSGENLESMLSILVGVNIQEPMILAELEKFKADAGITQFVPLADANRQTLAKLAAFISQSISSQSKALGSGSVSQTIQF